MSSLIFAGAVDILHEMLCQSQMQLETEFMPCSCAWSKQGTHAGPAFYVQGHVIPATFNLCLAILTYKI